MSLFDKGEQPSLTNVGSKNGNDVALDSAAMLFEQTTLLRSANANEGTILAQSSGPLFQQGSGSAFRDAIRNRVPGTTYPPGEVGDGSQQNRGAQTVIQPEIVQQGSFPERYPSVTDRVPTPVSNLPGLKYAPRTSVEPSIIESTTIKKTDLNEPYQSKTSDQANYLFESVGRAGASAYFINRDYAKRTLAVEARIAATELVSPGNRQNFTAARDGLLSSLKTPIQNAEVGVEAMYKRYPGELFQGSTIPKLEGGGKIMLPHSWDMTKLSIADQEVAERFLKLSSLKEQLVAHWPPVASTQLGRLPVNVQGMPFIQAEKLVAEAAKFDAAGAAFTGEVTKVLQNNNALRAANTNQVFKGAGVMAGAWLTNTATDVLVNTKHGPSMVTWTADLASPAILFTGRSMLTKFGVVAGAHLAAKLYDKYTEKP